MICLPSRRMLCARARLLEGGEPVEVAAGRERPAPAREEHGPSGPFPLQLGEEQREVVVELAVDPVDRRVGWSMVATRTSPSRSSLIVSTVRT